MGIHSHYFSAASRSNIPGLKIVSYQWSNNGIDQFSSVRAIQLSCSSFLLSPFLWVQFRRSKQQYLKASRFHRFKRISSCYCAVVVARSMNPFTWIGLIYLEIKMALKLKLRLNWRTRANSCSLEWTNVVLNWQKTTTTTTIPSLLSVPPNFPPTEFRSPSFWIQSKF